MINEKIAQIFSEAESLGCPAQRGALLKEYTTFKIGGKCDLLVNLNGEESAIKLIPLAERLEVPYYIFGKGSNLIVDSSGIDGVVFVFGDNFSNIVQKDDTTLICSSGTSIPQICEACLEKGLSGFEFAYGIPGTLGGAVYMNAGAWGGEIKDVVTDVKAMDRQGNIKVYNLSELHFSYRHSRFSETKEVILSAQIHLKKSDKNEIKSKMDELYQRRKSRQPIEFPSAGSMFKNPEGTSASLLIDQCGLKGRSVGDVEVSTKHAGFIINKGNADFSQLMKLIEIVKETVKEKKGFELQCEPQIIWGKSKS